jgi:hypothetical protein
MNCPEMDRKRVYVPYLRKKFKLRRYGTVVGSGVLSVSRYLIQDGLYLSNTSFTKRIKKYSVSSNRREEL